MSLSGLYSTFTSIFDKRPPKKIIEPEMSQEYHTLMEMKKVDLFTMAAELDCTIPPAATKKKLSVLIINKKRLDNSQ